MIRFLVAPFFLLHSFNDGMLEVMGVYSSFHIAQLQVGLVDPIRLGQAKIVKVRIAARYIIVGKVQRNYAGKQTRV